jgi:hypothetical protein
VLACPSFKQCATPVLPLFFARFADSLIEQLSQKKVSEIFAEDGEAEFRELETQVLAVSRSRAGVSVSRCQLAAVAPHLLSRLKRYPYISCIIPLPQSF